MFFVGDMLVALSPSYLIILNYFLCFDAVSCVIKCSLKIMASKGCTAASASTAIGLLAQNLQIPPTQRNADTASAEIINDHSLNSNFIWDVFCW